MGRVLITGCGRSGTQYIARVLKHLGLHATHERIYRQDLTPQNFSLREIDKRWQEQESEIEVSWLAAPFVYKQTPGTVVWHQTRHPLKVVRCWASHGYLTPEEASNVLPVPDVGLYIQKFLPQCKTGSKLYRAIQYVLGWNSLAETLPRIGSYFRYQVERLNPALLDSLLTEAGFLVPRVRIEKALREVQPGIGGCPPSEHIELGWKRVLSEAGGPELKEMSDNYGYGI